MNPPLGVEVTIASPEAPAGPEVEKAHVSQTPRFKKVPMILH